MGAMRDLLTEWAKLEPEKCKRETRPNVDWQEEFEDFYIAQEAGNKGDPGYGQGWQLILTDKEPRGYFPWQSAALMRVEWAVQTAIVERKFNLSIDKKEQGMWHVFINDGIYQGWADSDNLAEALLKAYLEVIEDK